MRVLLFCIGLLTAPSAHAVTLDGAGQGAAGVDGMWSMIRSTFVLGAGSPLTPLGAVTFFRDRIIVFAFSIIGALAVGLIMYAGIKLMIGGEEGIADAKKIILHTLVGLALALLAGVVIAFVAGIAGTLLS